MGGTQMSFHEDHLKDCWIDSGEKRGERILLPDFKRHKRGDIVHLETTNCKDELAEARALGKKLYYRHPGTVTYYVACQNHNKQFYLAG